MWFSADDKEWDLLKVDHLLSSLISHLLDFIVYDFCINSYYKFSTRLVPYIVVVKSTNIIKITKIKIIICTVNSS